MTVCRLCQCEPMVMTKPETDGITYFYVHYVECSGCGVATKRYSEMELSVVEGVKLALVQWEQLNSHTS